MDRWKIWQRFGQATYDKRITYVIRGLLIAALAYVVVSLFIDGHPGGFSSSSGEILFSLVLSIALTFSFDYLEKHHNIRIPHLIATTSLIFVFCSLFLGNVADFFTAFWWWDDLLHLFSSILLGLAGFLLIYYFNYRFSLNLSPVFLALFVLSFAVLMGVLWEIFEFGMDYFTGSNMQRWSAPADVILIGKDYQGLGLRDTMSDLILDVTGGLIASLYTFYLFKNEKTKALKILRETFSRKGK